MSLLLIDAGNSQSKWAICQENASIQTPITDVKSIDSTSIDPKNHTWLNLNLGQDIRHIYVSSVLSDALQQNLSQRLSQEYAGISIQYIAQHKNLLHSSYKNIAQLGSDRFANLLASQALMPAQNLLIISAGTATTIDLLDSSGEHRGGLILPGLGLMQNALANATGQLPKINSFANQIGLANSTEEAIQQGTLAAHIGAVELLISKLDETVSQIVLTGGYASWIAPHLNQPVIQIPDLVLRGLLCLHKKLNP